jgi:crotonobetainyl-CoA:carnitine CoA-transferase CaiB-like acyl-CoA transferase
VPYEPLRGVKVLDLGRLIPPALTTQRLASMGADVVKVEAPGRGDYLDQVPPFYAGHSPVHMTHNAGKRSVRVDARTEDGRELLRQLAAVADVIVENSRPGAWLSTGLDFAEMRRHRPELIVCSITGFGQTGPWAGLPSHGLTMDALADAVNIETIDGEPRLGWVYTSWGSELGAQNAATAICAALAHTRGGGGGVWIDVSCWDAAVESHRNEVAADLATGRPVSTHGRRLGAIYEVYRAADGELVLLASLEPKFWAEFCHRVERMDLLGHGGSAEIDYGGDNPTLRRELAGVFAGATAVEWERRFVEWGVPGGRVLTIDQAIRTAHFRARQLVEERAAGSYPVVTTPVRWHDHGTRAGTGLPLPPEHGADTEQVLKDWLGVDRPRP